MYVLASSLQCRGFEADLDMWERTQAIVGLPLNRGAEECLTNTAYPLPRGVTVVLSSTVPHGQAAGTAEDPTGNLRCIVGLGLMLTSASHRSAMVAAQGSDLPYGVARMRGQPHRSQSLIPHSTTLRQSVCRTANIHSRINEA